MERVEGNIVMILILPWPISVNRLYVNNNRKQRVLSNEGHSYKNAVGEAIMVNKVRYGLPYCNPCMLFIDYYPPTRREYDVDNFLKIIFDALEVAPNCPNGAVWNDHLIHELHVKKRDVTKPGKIIIRLAEL